MSKTWKRRETDVAEFFGLPRSRGRTPLSGGNSGHTRSDTLHEFLYIEHKHRKRHALVRLWDETKRLAKREGKTPLVSISEKGRPGFWVVCHSSDLVEVAAQRIKAIKNK